MDPLDLTGYYIYRSFLNRPEPVDDFNKIRFAEGELFLWVAPDGVVQGTLGFPADPFATDKDFMDITGRVTSWSLPALELEGIGRSETGTEEFDYKYQVSVAPTFPDADRQRPGLVGTVLRAKPHGTAAAGFTASLVAVKRDFSRPKDIAGVALIPDAIDMMASRGHRLQHAVWHTVRTQWHKLSADDNAVKEIDARGWWPKRPPFLAAGGLNLENGAGEDFLYMHRRMILMSQEVYANAGVSAPAGWTALPSAAVPQTAYREMATSGAKTFEFDPDASGDMVPPPAQDDDADRMVKSPAFLNGVMRPLSVLFQSPRFLSAMTLGQLGNLLEFTIHGWIHVRWTHTLYDPETGGAIVRNSLFDIDPKWDDPSNDDLGDFYSSHVHPTFWRLHGWIDDRINDWATANADRITPITVAGVPWFKMDGQLVRVSDPFSWPSHHPHHGPDHDDAEVHVMEEVMALMKNVLEPPTPPSAALGERALSRPRPARLAFRDVLLGISVAL